MKKYLFWLGIFSILEIGMALYLTSWRESFWNDISNKNATGFITQLVIFSAVALAICFVSGFSGYLSNLTSIKWREKLNSKAFSVCESTHSIENLNQRIQEDCMSYPDLVLNLAIGGIKALMYIIVFSISLMLYFHWWYLSILIAYTIIGSILTNYIAKPLIHLNYEQQRAEASYRNDLTITNFKDCIFIMLGLAKKQKHLTYFQQFYGQVGVVLPLLIIAPTYFHSAMTIGLLMRFSSLSSTILDNMSFGINSFAMINRLLSCKRRLKEAKIL